MTENELRDAITSLIETYPDAKNIRGAFDLTRGRYRIIVTVSDPREMDGIDLWNVARYRIEGDMRASQPDFMVDVPTSAVLPTLDEIVPMIQPTVEVEIPGTVIAEYNDGKIVGLTFTPHAGDAGYFGPSALKPEDVTLDVEDTEGPFWRAVQHYLAEEGGILWTE